MFKIEKIIKSYEMVIFKTTKNILCLLCIVLLPNFSLLAAEFAEERDLAVNKVRDGLISEGLNDLKKLSLNNDVKYSSICPIKLMLKSTKIITKYQVIQMDKFFDRTSAGFKRNSLLGQR